MPDHDGGDELYKLAGIVRLAGSQVVEHGHKILWNGSLKRPASRFRRASPAQLNRADASCRLVSDCRFCAVVPKPLPFSIPIAGVNEMSDSVPKRL
jgi:hypothetical protein